MLCLKKKWPSPWDSMSTCTFTLGSSLMCTSCLLCLPFSTLGVIVPAYHISIHNSNLKNKNYQNRRPSEIFKNDLRFLLISICAETESDFYLIYFYHEKWFIVYSLSVLIFLFSSWIFKFISNMYWHSVNLESDFFLENFSQVLNVGKTVIWLTWK